MAPAPSLATLMVASGLAVLSLNMFLPSLPQIARDFGVSYAAAGWSVSGYLALTAVLQLLLGPLSDRIGRRPVVLFAVVSFAVLSAVCALATSFTVFLVARMLQGVIIAGSTMALASVRDTSGAAAAARRISWVAMGMAVGPMVGPAIGGVLDAAFGWRSIFWTLSGGGALLSLLVFFNWGETNTSKSASFGAQFRAYPTLLASPAFWAFSGAVVTGVGCFYVFISGAPYVADQVLNISTAQVGIAVGIITAGFFVGNGVSGRIAESVGLGLMVLSGRLLQVAAIAANLLLLFAGYFNPLTFFGLMAIVGFGNGIANPSAHAGLMSVNPALAGSAAGLSGALVLAFGAFFTATSARLLELGPPATTLLVTMLILSLLGAATGWAAYRLSGTLVRAETT
ncbi:MAG: MFS transporter [Pseudomonadota bacterium]